MEILTVSIINHVYSSSYVSMQNNCFRKIAASASTNLAFVHSNANILRTHTNTHIQSMVLQFAILLLQKCTPSSAPKQSLWKLLQLKECSSRCIFLWITIRDLCWTTHEYMAYMWMHRSEYASMRICTYLPINDVFRDIGLYNLFSIASKLDSFCPLSA